MADNGHKRPGGGGGPFGHQGPGQKADNFWKSIGRLFKYMGVYRVMIIVSFAFSAISTVFFVVGPKILGNATSELASGLSAKISGNGGMDFDTIGRILITVLIIYSIGALFSFLASLLMTHIAQNLTFKMRKDISVKLNKLPMSYFESRKHGDILSAITNDVDTLGQALNQSISTIVTSIATIIGVVVMMLTINPLLTLIAVVMIPVSFGLITLTVKKSQKHFIAQQQHLASLNGQVEENYAGHLVVTAFNKEEDVIKDFKEENKTMYTSAWKSQFISGLMQPITFTIGNVAYVAVAIFGSMLAINGTIRIGDIQAFIQYVRNLAQPIQQMSQVMTQVQTMAAAAERVFQFIDEPDEKVVENPIALPEKIKGKVEFEHVRFGYVEGQTIINDFTFTAQPHNKVAIVGPTGAGKTTLVKLLMRFYDLNGGSIKIDGVDIGKVDRSEVRSEFGMVLQDTWLFGGTIMENLRYGREDATDEEVIQAAKAAYADHFINNLPDGYNTVLNEDASNLSLGERQLLTIARAFLADRKMLILDEATSSVDTRTEAIIQSAMDNLMKGRTSFVIAHRLSTIKNADQILVLNKGDIVEHGNHDELLAQGGFYADLYNSQFSEEEE